MYEENEKRGVKLKEGKRTIKGDGNGKIYANKENVGKKAHGQ